MTFLFCKSNIFFDAYMHSDYLGKCIFLSLLATSFICWTVFLYKLWLLFKVKKNSYHFHRYFSKKKHALLHMDCEKFQSYSVLNYYYYLYMVLKKQAIDILNKNHRFSVSEGKEEKTEGTFLSSRDIEFIEANMVSSIGSLVKRLEKNLFVLSTIVGLAPLLGLLGTVWGILITFSALPQQIGGMGQTVLLGGLSLALTTTVLGLFTAIPSLIAYNYLKDRIEEFAEEMKKFVNDCLLFLEMQYRIVEAKK